MRVYYVFKINNLLNTSYEKRPVSIYKLLNKINTYNKNEYKSANRLYRKVVIKIDKRNIDNYILMNHINDFYYTKHNLVHELYSNKEMSKLIIYNTYIKIITTNNLPSFFKDIFMYGDNFFAVDFNNKDYFYLDEFKLNVLAC